MKKIVLILIAFVAITATAQRGNPRAMQKLSAEEAATLQTKKMTLALALSDAQAKQVYQVNLKQAIKRKAILEARKTNEEKKEPSIQNRIERKNNTLDAKIAIQNEMKRILDEDQFKQWRRMNQRKNKKGKPQYSGRRNRK